jgi:hypothetical protein
MKDEPPRIVVSTKAGEIPRYSASARPEVRVWAVAQSRPSTSRNASPQSPSARDALRHQIDRVHFLGDGAQIRLCDTHDRGAAALQSVHYTGSTGVTTG